MEIQILFIYFIASSLLFFILNYIKKNYENVIHYGIVTCIYLLVVSGIISNININYFHNSIYVIYLLELFLRIFYENMIRDVNFFRDREYLYRYAISLILIILMNVLFIDHVKSVFPSINQLKLMIWIGIFGYVIFMFKSNINIYLKKREVSKNNNKNDIVKESIIISYAKLKNQYGRMVRSRYSELFPVIYSIMVYENKNRPSIFRRLDYLLYRFDGKGRRFGIMQIYSKYYIDDYHSISIAIRRLEKIYYSMKKKGDRNILSEYYKKDSCVREVMKILRVIRDFDKK